MRTRVQFIVDPIAKGRYNQTAWAAGLTLSEWARRTLDAAATAEVEEGSLRTRAGLASFFESVNQPHRPYPPWSEEAE